MNGHVVRLQGVGVYDGIGGRKEGRKDAKVRRIPRKEGMKDTKEGRIPRKE